MKAKLRVMVLGAMCVVMVACSREPIEPPINDETCAHVDKVDSRVREKVGSACARRGDFVPSPVRKW